MAPFAQSECHKEARTVIQLLKLFRFATFFALLRHFLPWPPSAVFVLLQP